MWKVFLKSALSGAAQGADGALQGGTDFKTVGVASAAGAVAGLLQALLAHPAAQHASVQAAAKPVLQ